MRKLKEYLKTSVQERKHLLKKIGTLNERIAEAAANNANAQISSAPNSGVFPFGPKSASVQCNLASPADSNSLVESESGGGGGGRTTSFTQLHNSRYLFLRIANLQQRLANSCEDADVLRSHLESLLDSLEPYVGLKSSPISNELLSTVKKVIQDSRDVSKAISRAPTPLVFDSTNEGKVESSFDDCWKSNSSLSSWKNGLPDPSLVDLESQDGGGGASDPHAPPVRRKLVRIDSYDGLSEDENEFSAGPAAVSKVGAVKPVQNVVQHDNVIRKLSDEIERRNQDLENKMAVLDMLEEQLEEKDRVIIEQGGLLDEYRQEILRLRDEDQLPYNEKLPTGASARPKRYRSFCSRRRAASSGGGGQNPGSSQVNPHTCPSDQVNWTNHVAARALSDGEDSWSEPDISAARKRMGLSAAIVNSRIKDKESSETDLEKRKLNAMLIHYSRSVKILEVVVIMTLREIIVYQQLL